MKKEIQNKTTEQMLAAPNYKEIISFCRKTYPLIKIRLKHIKGFNWGLCWTPHPRYKKAGANRELIQQLSIRFSGKPWIIWEQLQTDFPWDWRDIMWKFITSSLHIGERWLSDMTIYIGNSILSDEFMIEYCRAEFNLTK